MKREQSNNQLAKRRRFLLVLPLLVIPFLTMAFWAMGGGKGTREAAPDGSIGLKTALPDANLKEEGDQTKLSFYERADQDSAEGRRRAEMDGVAMGVPDTRTDTVPRRLSYDPYPHHSARLDPNEQKVYQKLAQINSQLGTAPVGKQKENTASRSSRPVMASDDVDRLEAMLGMMGGATGEDPEMDRIEGVMEKILDIQHPERVKARGQVQNVTEKKGALPVAQKGLKSTISRLDTLPTKKELNTSAGFYSLTGQDAGDGQNAIRAVVPEGRTLVNGAIIKLQLLDDISVGGVTIPKSTFVFGAVLLAEERLRVEITSIRFGPSLYPVKLKVYDMDGLEGIFIPGAINREVAKNSAADATALLDIGSYDPSLKMQVANAGIGAAKSLLNKKVKMTKVFVKPGYQVLLYSEER